MIDNYTAAPVHQAQNRGSPPPAKKIKRLRYGLLGWFERSTISQPISAANISATASVSIAAIMIVALLSCDPRGDST